MYISRTKQHTPYTKVSYKSCMNLVTWPFMCLKLKVANVQTNVVCVNSLGFISVNFIMKFIYTLCKCIIFIYICVGINVEYKMRKCKIM